MWPYFWIVLMLGLITATVVVGMREKKARQAAVKQLTPQPMNASGMEGLPAADDGFGETDPLGSFGEDSGGEMAALDDKSFK